jgi:hypothetical protein
MSGEKNSMELFVFLVRGDTKNQRRFKNQCAIFLFREEYQAVGENNLKR